MTGEQDRYGIYSRLRYHSQKRTQTRQSQVIITNMATADLGCAGPGRTACRLRSGRVTHDWEGTVVRRKYKSPEEG